MKKLDFLVLCGEMLIDPALALDNEKIKKALAERDDAKVRELLKSEF